MPSKWNVTKSFQSGYQNGRIPAPDNRDCNNVVGQIEPVLACFALVLAAVHLSAFDKCRDRLKLEVQTLNAFKHGCLKCDNHSFRCSHLQHPTTRCSNIWTPKCIGPGAGTTIRLVMFCSLLHRPCSRGRSESSRDVRIFEMSNTIKARVCICIDTFELLELVTKLIIDLINITIYNSMTHQTM